MIILTVIFLLIHLGFAALVCFLVLAFFTGAPFVATPKKIVSEMILLAGLKKDDVVVDLGSGDGRILLAASKHAARVIGWEINPFLVALSRLKALFSVNRRKITVHWGNLYRADLAKADAVFVYGIKDHMLGIKKKLKESLKKGTRVVSYTFPFPDWKEKKGTASGIYLYQV